MKNVPIGSVCSLINGKAFKSSDWQTSGIPIVRIQNLNNPKAEFNYISEVEEKYLIDDGELLFAWSGTPGTSFGAHFWNRGKGALNQHIFKVVLDPQVVSKQYFRYALNSKLMQIISQAHGGVGLQHITKTKLVATEIPLPPLPEQKRIAAILDKADAIRRKRRDATRLADTFLRSAFLKMFGDPVTNPMGWDEKNVSDFAKVIRGSSPRPKGDARYYGGPVARLMIQDITRDGWFVTPKVDSLTVEGSKKSRPVQAGTLVMAVSANVGLVARLNVDACIHDGFAAIIDLDDCVHPNYLMFAFHELKNTHARRQTGAIWKNITTGQIREIKVPIPPLEDQKRFNMTMEKILHHNKQLADLIGFSNNLFSSLQQRAFRGDL